MRRFCKFSRQIIVSLAVIVFLSGCNISPEVVTPTSITVAPNQHEEPQGKGVLRLGWQTRQTFNAFRQTDDMGKAVMALVCPGLFHVTSKHKVENALASEARWSEDGLMLHVKIRQDLLFSNQAPITVTDCVASVLEQKETASLQPDTGAAILVPDMIMPNMATFRRAEPTPVPEAGFLPHLELVENNPDFLSRADALAAITNVAASAEDEITITLNRVVKNLPFMLTGPVVPSAMVKDQTSYPVGAGAFMFSGETRSDGVVDLVRRASGAGIERINLITFATSQLQRQAFVDNQLDALLLSPQESANQPFSSNGREVQIELPRLRFVGINTNGTLGNREQFYDIKSILLGSQFGLEAISFGCDFGSSLISNTVGLADSDFDFAKIVFAENNLHKVEALARKKINLRLLAGADAQSQFLARQLRSQLIKAGYGDITIIGTPNAVPQASEYDLVIMEKSVSMPLDPSFELSAIATKLGLPEVGLKSEVSVIEPFALQDWYVGLDGKTPSRIDALREAETLRRKQAMSPIMIVGHRSQQWLLADKIRGSIDATPFAAMYGIEGVWVWSGS